MVGAFLVLGAGFHVAVYVLAVVGLVAAGERALRLPPASRKKRHDALMARIAQLEVSAGVGVDYARHWIEQQPKVTRNSHLPMSGTWWCYGCGEWHESNGYGFHKLCKRARGESR
jgi:hypothetical protein